MSDNKKQTQDDVNEMLIAAYDKHRARHFLNDLLMPLIREGCKKTKQTDVFGSSEMKFLVDSVHGSESALAWENKVSKFGVN